MVLIKIHGHIVFEKNKKKSWDGCHHLLLVYDDSKLSTVYIVKWPVLGLQRAFENSVFPPSVLSSLLWLRFCNHLFLIPNFSYKIIRFLLHSYIIISDNRQTFLLRYKMSLTYLASVLVGIIDASDKKRMQSLNVSHHW